MLLRFPPSPPLACLGVMCLSPPCRSPDLLFKQIDSRGRVGLTQPRAHLRHAEIVCAGQLVRAARGPRECARARVGQDSRSGGGCGGARRGGGEVRGVAVGGRRVGRRGRERRGFPAGAVARGGQEGGRKRELGLRAVCSSALGRVRTSCAGSRNDHGRVREKYVNSARQGGGGRVEE